MAGPPGKPMPRKRASLSKASPAASSMVPPITWYTPQSAMCTIWLWPPEASSTTAGGWYSGPSRRGANRWPSMWSMPRKGFDIAHDSALP